jgi:hypothetical protein
MTYHITQYSFNQAEALGVIIKPSNRKNKKIDVYKEGVKIASIGDDRYKDYPTYIKENGKAYADQRKKLYKIRHEKDRKKTGSNGFYADKILW